MAQYTKYIAVLILLSLHTTSSVPMKTNSHPVIEVNEYSRIDENLRPPTLPYGNPLAGNSKQNARLHAQNQQAMFNAERLRQHRAQLQRWTKAPQQEDSYMKAYHESQENHQLDLEQKLRNSRHVTKLAFNRENVHMGVTKPISVIDNKHIAVTKAPVRTRVPIHQPKRGMEYGPDVIKITKEDAIIPEKNRPHRSYGSVHFKPIIQSKKFQTVVSLSAGPTYDQGVTIKPNGNNGFASQSNGIPQEPKLYTSITSAIPNEGQYVYPQYGQAHNYESANNIHTLNSLLNKPASEQLTEFNALINNDKNPATETKDPLTTPIDLYFYLKDSDPNSLTKYYEQSSYGEVAPTYASAYTNPVKDHIPITEEVDDIEDPNNNNRLKQYGLQSFTPTAEKLVETTTIKTNNYYKVEVASQTITAPVKKPAYYKKEEETKPTYEILQYASPTYGQELEESERYLHHKAQNAGIQNLNEDGIGVSAYADENVSISNVNLTTSDIKIHVNINSGNKTRKTRSLENLNLDSFKVSKEKQYGEKVDQSNDTTPIAEPLVRVHHFPTKNKFSSVLTQNHPIGVANDYESDEDEFQDYEDEVHTDEPSRFNSQDKYAIYDDDYEIEDSDYELDYDSPKPKIKHPNLDNYHNDVSGSYSTKKRVRLPLQQKFPPKFSLQNSYGVPIQDTYGIPNYASGFTSHIQNYGPPLHDTYAPPSSSNPPEYGPPYFSTPPNYGPSHTYGNPINQLTSHGLMEPLYIFTQSQLKSLIGDNNFNVEHYDIYQFPKSNKRKPRRPRKYKKRYSGRRRKVKKNLGKLKKLRLL